MSFELSPSVKFALNFVHPTIMWLLLGLSLYSGYLGLQIQRARNAEGETKIQLNKGRYKEKHHLVGSIILAFIVIGAIGGMAVTYINNGKLFFGPHLLAGLGITALVASSASLSPFLQKGANWARVAHILLNSIIIGLFAWQAITGTEIVQRILAKA